MKDPLLADLDEVTLTGEKPCNDGECRERLCGRMKRELRFFSFMAEENLDQTAGYFECRQLPAGATLWQEGESGDFIAFVVSGRLEISKQTEFAGKPIVVGILSRGAMVGELSVLEGSPRSETAVVLDRLDLILLSRANLQRLLAERPPLGIHLLQGMLLTVSRRLTRSYERLASIF
ncbi:MAG: cyclic nucleotide-binding domain-containing protein [Desulfuromonadales bacterium]|nr:cyclic nucleotide-binding domain-containing protein [Desulfuromonadales bacterium]